MNHEQSIAVRKPVPTSEHQPRHLSPGQPTPTKQPNRSPLPSAREIDAAIERNYGAPPYREMALSR